MRSAIGKVLALLLLASGLLIPPDAVLCIGPSNHCHLEIVVGASCNGAPREDRAAAPTQPDGCPQGSRDFRLSVDTHRTDSSRLTTACDRTVAVAIAMEAPRPGCAPLLAGLPLPAQAPLSITVLRC